MDKVQQRADARCSATSWRTTRSSSLAPEIIPATPQSRKRAPPAKAAAEKKPAEPPKKDQSRRDLPPRSHAGFGGRRLVDAGLGRRKTGEAAPIRRQAVPTKPRSLPTASRRQGGGEAGRGRAGRSARLDGGAAKAAPLRGGRRTRLAPKKPAAARPDPFAGGSQAAVDVHRRR